jgi:hypothetical protein
MPRIIDCDDQQLIDLEGCIDAIAVKGFNPNDETSLQNAALNLKRLGNDTDFLGDILMDELANRHRDASTDSAYGPQAIMLSDARHGFFLRANIWPSETDNVFAASGAHNFSYGTPHDHNFDFLTLGYFGPGYVSDYYEYDYDSVAGFAGEKAGLRFIERSTLDPGKLMHYRAHRDVHSQLPPESMSVSLNVMVIDPAQAWRDQYSFDTEKDEIAGVLNPTSTEVFLRLAVGLGDENALDLAERFGALHPSDRLRLAAFEARDMLCDDVGGRDQIWREAEQCGSRLVAHEARIRRSALV